MTIYEQAKAQHEAHKIKRAGTRSYTLEDDHTRYQRRRRLAAVTDENRALAAHWLADATAATQLLASLHRTNDPQPLCQDLITEARVSLRAAEHYRLGLM